MAQISQTKDIDQKQMTTIEDMNNWAGSHADLLLSQDVILYQFRESKYQYFIK